MKNKIKLIAAIPMIAMLGACTTAPKALDEPHPDDNAYRWKPLFDKTLSNAEFKAGAWHSALAMEVSWSWFSAFHCEQGKSATMSLAVRRSPRLQVDL